jgi:signal transduction histidine kinase
MMYKILFLFSIFVNSLFGFNSFDISKKESLNIKDYIYYIEDKNSSLDFYDIKNSNNLKKVIKTNLGYSFNTFWTKIDLTNSSNKVQSYILYNPRPGMDYIDIKIFQNNKIIKEYQLGDMRSLDNRSFHSIFSNISLNIEPNETITIISKYNTIANIEIGWKVQTIDEFINYNQLNFTLIILYIGFMIALLFNKLFNFYYIKDKLSLIYSVFILSAIISHFSATGMMHYYFYDTINLFSISASQPILSHIFLATLWLFTYYFFEISKKEKLRYIFYFVIIYNIFIMIIYATSYIDIKVFALTPIILLLALIETILLFIITFIMMIRKKTGSILFFIAHLFYITSIAYYILNLSGKELGPIDSMHIAALGIFLATTFMSLALGAKFKIIKDENDKSKIEIEKNKQYTIIGTSIAYITHEWKQPLSILASQVTKLQAIADNKPNMTIKELETDINKMQNNIKFISNTLDSIKSLFKIETKINDSFMLSEVMKELSRHFNENLSNIELIIKIDDIKIKGDKNLFIHALRNIKQNSIDAFENKTITNKKIQIYTKENKNNDISIIIEDNAGGIPNNIDINKIFDKKSSIKTNGMGIGLSITKNILLNEFKMNIIVENSDKGCKFIISNI